MQAMSHYGFEIVQTLIVDIEPDEHVKRAMNEINAGTICTYDIWNAMFFSLLFYRLFFFRKPFQVKIHLFRNFTKC